MDDVFASALPRKRFFLEMFTRDIRLIDCILDLVDNSIDALIRRDKIDLRNAVLRASEPTPNNKLALLPRIDVKYDATAFTIIDNCGGIPVNSAIHDTFNFGHTPEYSPGKKGSRLGAYGIGMKRAIFKIGNHFRVESKTSQKAFTVDVNVKEWAKKDKTADDWRFPIRITDRDTEKHHTGTTIQINDFTPPIALALQDGALTNELISSVAKTYCLFLNRFVVLYVNGDIVTPTAIPIGTAEGVTPERRHISLPKVSVDILATLGARAEGQTWQTETAGWYVVCNGRVVVHADKTDLTGWDRSIVPQFQPKHRGFLGIVNYVSKDPLKLPWTTTKRSLDRDAPAFRMIRQQMQAAARPIVKLLESFYGPDKFDSEPAKETISVLNATDVRKALRGQPSRFNVTRKQNTASHSVDTTQINFTAKNSDVEKIRKHNRLPRLAKAKIGELVFEYYLRSEGLKR